MRLLVGRLGRAHGIHGEATIEVRTDNPADRFAIGARVQTDTHGDLLITSHRVHNGILLLGFENIADRNAIDENGKTALILLDEKMHESYVPMLAELKPVAERLRSGK